MLEKMDNSILLKVTDLEASVNSVQILKKINFTAKKGQIHVIMGPNGCGKSTFSKVLAGHPLYDFNGGNAFFKNQNLLLSSPESRSKLGLFLAFQYPLEISGLSTFDFLHFSYNERQKFLRKTLLTPLEFLVYIKPFCEKLQIAEGFLYRNFNEGFSGGEKKKNEILQMFVLDPDLIILDELDSGLDIDALRLIYQSIQEYSLKEREKTFIVVTHNFKIFDYITPDCVHLMLNGKIIKEGSSSLLDDLEKNGYKFFTE